MPGVSFSPLFFAFVRGEAQRSAAGLVRERDFLRGLTNSSLHSHSADVLNDVLYRYQMRKQGGFNSFYLFLLKSIKSSEN